MRRLLIAAVLLMLGSPVRAAETCVTLDDKAVAALFDEWNFALSSLDAAKVTQKYWPEAVLLPTVSDTPRTSPAMINDYFAHFLAQRPRGRIDTRTIHTGCNMAVDMGTYTFSLMDDKGTTSEVAARYTFVYEYRDGAWKILHQHSSAMPGAGANADARVAREDDTEASTPAKPPKAEPSASKPRKERRSKRKDDLDDVPVAAKPAEKPTPIAVADAKAPTPAKPAPAAAPPTDTKSAPEVRTAMFANLTSSPSPSKFYPPEAMRRKERGSVNLKVCADSTGVVAENVEVLRSSGSKLLDDAATSWARAVTWVPATYNRQRVEGCSTVDVAFEPPAELANARR